MGTVAVTESPSQSVSLDVEGGDVYEMLAEHMVSTLKMVRDTVATYLEGLSGAERARAEHAIKQMNEYIEKLEKQRKSSGLQKFLKALGPIGLIIAAIAAFIAPSPMTIALLVVAVALFLEPMISKAAGAQSIVEQGMGEIFKGLSEVMGPVAAAVIAAVLLLVIVIFATAAVAAGLALFNATATTASTAMQAILQYLKDLPKLIMQAFTTTLDPAKTQKLQTFLEFAQSTILAAQAGIQVDMATINFEIAKLMRSFGIEQAVIDQWMKIIEMVSKDMGGAQDLIQFLQSLMPQLFDQGVTQ
jgi:hypothetical protein